MKGPQNTRDLTDGFLRDAHGDPLGTNMLYSMVTEIIIDYADAFGNYQGVDTSRVIERVLDRIRVGEVGGITTLVNRVRTVDGSGRGIRVDRDIVAGALTRERPGRALTAYLRNLVRETARSLSRRAERTRRIQLTSANEPVEAPDTLDEDVEWLRAELTRLPSDVRRALLEYYLIGGRNQLDVAKRMGISRDQLQTLLDVGRRTLRSRYPVFTAA